MSLASSFEKSDHLGVLAKAWWTALQERMSKAGVSSTVKTSSQEAASLIAPAALAAQVVRQAFPAQKVLRVLVLGRDPLFRLDGGRWLSYANDFLGVAGQIEFLTLIDEEAPTSFGSVASELALSRAKPVTPDQAVSGEGSRADLVIWVHPVNEVESPESEQQAALAIRLAESGVPVYSCHFSELDHLSQDIIVNPCGWSFQLLDETPVNRFGISLNGTGIRGGWGAVLSRLARASGNMPAASISAVRHAFAVLREEGGGSSTWNLGDQIKGPAGEGGKLVGLLGGMAMDAANGRVYHVSPDAKSLDMIGQMPGRFLREMPQDLKELTVWASRAYLNFLTELPPDEKQRKVVVGILQNAIDAGIDEACVGLARCYEATNRQPYLNEADRLYRSCAARSPMAAYYVAHQCMTSDPAKGHELLHFAAEHAYPFALCDLGISLYQSADTRQKGLDLLKQASAAGDVTASYHLAVLAVQVGQYEEAKSYLKGPVECGDGECAEFYLKIVEAQIKSGAGDRKAYKNQQSWVRTRMKKMKGRARAESA